MVRQHDDRRRKRPATKSSRKAKELSSSTSAPAPDTRTSSTWNSVVGFLSSSSYTHSSELFSREYSLTAPAPSKKSAASPSFQAPSSPWAHDSYRKQSSTLGDGSTGEQSTDFNADCSRHNDGNDPGTAARTSRTAVPQRSRGIRDSKGKETSKKLESTAKAPQTTTKRPFLLKVTLLIATAIAIFGVGIFISYINAKYLFARRGYDTDPSMYQAAYDFWQTSPRANGTGARMEVRARPPAKGTLFSSDVRGLGSVVDDTAPRANGASDMAVEEHVRSTTQSERVWRKKKLQVWEGKRIYELSSKVEDTVITAESSVGVTRTSDEAEAVRVTQERRVIELDAPVTKTRRRKDTSKKYGVHFYENTTPTRSYHTTVIPKKINFCETKICEAESVYLTNYLSWNVKPCKDFYSFVCSRWKSLHPDVGTSADALLVQKVEEDIFHGLTTKERVTAQTLKAEQLLNACIRTPAFQDYRSILLDFMGSFGLRGWPFVRNTKTLIDVWKSAGLLVRNVGLHTLVSVDLEIDPDNDDRYMIALGEPSLLIGQYGTKDSILPEWYSMAVTTCFKIFTSGKYVEIAKRVRDFSVRLAEITLNRGYEEFSTNRYRVMQLKYHSNLIQLLKTVFNNITTVHSRMKVLVKSEHYLKSLRSVLHVSKGVDILNYLGFRILLHVSPLLPDQAIDLATIQMREITGISRRSWPRWRRCLRMFERVAPSLFLHTYALSKRRHKNPDKIWRLLNEIQATFVLGIGSAPWMSIDDKVMLKSKVARIKLEVFQKFWSKHSNRLPDEEIKLGIQHRGIIIIYKTLATQFMERQLSKIRLPRSVEFPAWKGSVFDTEPIFDRDSDTIFIPMALFDQSYMIDSESMLLQIPRVATKVISVLFRGIHQNNYPRSKLRWSVDTQMGYHDLQGCIQKHYERDNDQRIRLETRSELDTIDSLSIFPAFKVFVKKVNRINIEEYGLLTGINITVKQLFFVLYAKSFCETMDAERKRQIMQESVTSVNSLRVNGALRNSYRFPTFWDCASDSSMNPNQKCTIWTS
ncbi:neprilysin-21-like [Ornithodoros turicata]|uniref:neprilysin-21-like n=1 Tax=Ornithodoros turicata TaxID=34597 RepID=UPI00313A383C